MNGYTVSSEPPAAWQALCINHLFHSFAWQTFLQEVFGAHPPTPGITMHRQDKLLSSSEPARFESAMWVFPLAGLFRSGL